MFTTAIATDKPSALLERIAELLPWNVASHLQWLQRMFTYNLWGYRFPRCQGSPEIQQMPEVRAASRIGVATAQATIAYDPDM